MGESDAALEKVRFALLAGKTWRYLRYLHAREAMKLVDHASSVLVIGGGHALAEVALAMEFPRMRFHVTDHGDATHTTGMARRFIETFELGNIGFGELNILDPVDSPKYDVVYSVEVLEHIKDDEAAATNMCRIARKYVFALVPFAQDALNADPALRARVREKSEHEVVGYDAKRLARMFPNPVALRGTYWLDAGQELRKRLTAMNPDEMREHRAEIDALAQADLKPMIPVTMKEGHGIWTLARVHG